MGHARSHKPAGRKTPARNAGTFTMVTSVSAPSQSAPEIPRAPIDGNGTAVFIPARILGNARPGPPPGLGFLATIFRRDHASFGTINASSSSQRPLRRPYPTEGMMWLKDKEDRQRNHRPSCEHGNPVQHRDLVRRIFTQHISANDGRTMSGLPDLKDGFTCTVCRRRGADIRPDWQSEETRAPQAIYLSCLNYEIEEHVSGADDTNSGCIIASTVLGRRDDTRANSPLGADADRYGGHLPHVLSWRKTAIDIGPLRMTVACASF